MEEHTLTPWAFTKLKSAETCPRQFMARYISKTYPFIETTAQKDGEDIHKLFEDRIKYELPFPSDFTWCEQYVPTISGPTSILESELSLGITRENEPCDFWDSNCFFRGKLDCLNIEGNTAFIIDWKNGKPYEDPDELNLHSILVKALYPNVKHWRGLYVWLRERRVGETHILSPGRSYIRLLERVDNLQIEDKPKKNPFCKAYCELMNCEFNGKGTRHVT